MKIQRQLSNGTSWWDETDETRINHFIDMVLAREAWFAPRKNREPMTTREQVLAQLAAGNEQRYDDDWYANIRDADSIKPRQVRQPDYPGGRKLGCGCTVYYQSEVMSASMGSSCSSHYDRMSN